QIPGWNEAKGSSTRAKTSNEPTPGQPEVTQVIEVSARQFEWRMRYPSEAVPENPDEWSRRDLFDDVHVVNEVHVWKGADVRVYLKTRDVIHSFFMPQMRVKQDALPGKIIPVGFKPTKSNTRRIDDTWQYGWLHDERTKDWIKDKRYDWD